MNSLESRVKNIEKRNKKVEQDKAWETSWTRRLSITAMLYVITVIYLFLIDGQQPFSSALVPAGGYLISTLAFKTIKSIWPR